MRGWGWGWGGLGGPRCKLRHQSSVCKLRFPWRPRLPTPLQLRGAASARAAPRAAPRGRANPAGPRRIPCGPPSPEPRPALGPSPTSLDRPARPPVPSAPSPAGRAGHRKPGRPAGPRDGRAPRSRARAAGPLRRIAVSGRERLHCTAGGGCPPYPSSAVSLVSHGTGRTVVFSGSAAAISEPGGSKFV